MKTKLIVFDLDGTLVDTIDGLTLAMNRVLKQNNIEGHSRNAIMQYVGNGLGKLVERALPEHQRSRALIERCYLEMLEEYGRCYSHGLRLYDGMAEVLDNLAAQRISMAIYTNKDYRMAEGIAKGFLSRWLFMRVVGELPEKPKKPDPWAILEMIDVMGIQREEVLYVGDSEVDILTARNAGVRCLSALWGFRSEADMRPFNPEMLIQHPKAILEQL